RHLQPHQQRKRTGTSDWYGQHRRVFCDVFYGRNPDLFYRDSKLADHPRVDFRRSPCRSPGGLYHQKNPAKGIVCHRWAVDHPHFALLPDHGTFLNPATRFLYTLRNHLFLNSTYSRHHCTRIYVSIFPISAAPVDPNLRNTPPNSASAVKPISTKLPSI